MGSKKKEHIILISKYKQENSNMDRCLFKINIIIYQFVSILTFDHKICKKVMNEFKYFSLKHANYALVFVVRFHYYLKDRLLWPFRPSFREIWILHMKIMQDSVPQYFVSVSVSSFSFWNSEFHSRIISQTNKNVWISEIKSATRTTLYVSSKWVDWTEFLATSKAIKDLKVMNDHLKMAANPRMNPEAQEFWTTKHWQEKDDEFPSSTGH